MTADPYQAARISSQATAKTMSGNAQGTGNRSLHACPGPSPRRRAHPRLGDAVVDTTRRSIAVRITPRPAKLPSDLGEVLEALVGVVVVGEVGGLGALDREVGPAAPRAEAFNHQLCGLQRVKAPTQRGRQPLDALLCPFGVGQAGRVDGDL